MSFIWEGDPWRLWEEREPAAWWPIGMQRWAAGDPEVLPNVCPQLPSSCGGLCPQHLLAGSTAPPVGSEHAGRRPRSGQPRCLPSMNVRVELKLCMRGHFGCTSCYCDV